jgi:hypothetical protein
MIKNRTSFSRKNFRGWNIFGSLKLKNGGPLKKTPLYPYWPPPARPKTYGMENADISLFHKKKKQNNRFLFGHDFAGNTPKKPSESN